MAKPLHDKNVKDSPPKIMRQEGSLPCLAFRVAKLTKSRKLCCFSRQFMLYLCIQQGMVLDKRLDKSLVTIRTCAHQRSHTLVI